MTQITIRRLDPAVVQGLKSRATAAGHSMEQEARRILELAVLPSRDGVATRLRQAMTERQPTKGGVFSDSATVLRQVREQWQDLGQRLARQQE